MLVAISEKLSEKYDIAAYGYVDERLVIWVHREFEHPLGLPHFQSTDCWCSTRVVFYDEMDAEPSEMIIGDVEIH